MGGNAPLVQGAAAARNVNRPGVRAPPPENRKISRFHFCGIWGHVGSRSAPLCRTDVGIGADLVNEGQGTQCLHFAFLLTPQRPVRSAPSIPSLTIAFR